MCGKETWWNDGFQCDPCGACWSEIGDEGGWLDDQAPQCRKVLVHRRYPILSGRCIKPEDHASPEHHNGEWEWDSTLLRWRPEQTETEVVDLVKR